jgi:hypothetical protein
MLNIKNLLDPITIEALINRVYNSLLWKNMYTLWCKPRDHVDTQPTIKIEI